MWVITWRSMFPLLYCFLSFVGIKRTTTKVRHLFISAPQDLPSAENHEKKGKDGVLDLKLEGSGHVRTWKWQVTFYFTILYWPIYICTPVFRVFKKAKIATLINFICTVRYFTVLKHFSAPPSLLFHFSIASWQLYVLLCFLFDCPFLFTINNSFVLEKFSFLSVFGLLFHYRKLVA